MLKWYLTKFGVVSRLKLKQVELGVSLSSVTWSTVQVIVSLSIIVNFEIYDLKAKCVYVILIKKCTKFRKDLSIVNR